MYLSRVLRRCGAMIAVAVAAPGIVAADPTSMSGPHGFSSHDFHSMIPDGCRPPAYDGTRAPADFMKKFAGEIGLSGQQQQDLQILTADYGERLRDLAILGRESVEKLANTEPGNSDYWPLAQEVSASAAANTAETVILISELREKVNAILTADQRTELKRRLDELKAQCKPPVKADQPDR